MKKTGIKLFPYKPRKSKLLGPKCAERPKEVRETLASIIKFISHLAKSRASGIRKILNNRGILASGSTDHSIIFRNLYGEILGSLKCARNGVEEMPIPKCLEYFQMEKERGEGFLAFGGATSYAELGNLKGRTAIYIMDLEMGIITQRLYKQVAGTMNLKYIGDNRIVGAHYLKYGYNDHARGVITLWDVVTGEQLINFQETKKVQLSILYRPKEEHLITVGEESMFYIWNINTQNIYTQFASKQIFTRVVMENPKMKNELITCSSEGNIRTWDLEKYINTRTIERAHFTSILNMKSIGHPPSRIVTISRDQSIKIWDLNLNLLYTIGHAHQKAIYSLEVIGDDVIITGGMDNLISLWTILDYRLIRTFSGHKGLVHVISKLF